MQNNKQTSIVISGNLLGANKFTDEEKIEMYLDYVNNFNTVAYFADWYTISDEVAAEVIATGKSLHNAAADAQKAVR